MNNKKILRQSLRKKRNQLSLHEQQQKSLNIVKNVLCSDSIKHAKNIGYYHAVRGEADPAKLNIQHGQQYYLPVISDNKQQGLVFAAVTAYTQSQNNRFKIPEPISEANELIHVDKLDLLIMPLLGFDKTGNRLGMGGGFYDRSLAYKLKNPETKPVLMGFAYDFQEVDKLETEPWDIALDLIATENSLIQCE